MRSVRTWNAGVLTAALALAALSCDGDDDPTGNNGSFTIAVSPASQSVQRGTSTFVTVTLTRSGGFNGVVTLTISNSPAGVSATMDPALLSGGTVISRINLNVAGTATIGASTVTITGSSGNDKP